MSRQIIRASQVPKGRGDAPGAVQPDRARDRLMKMIPGETVALYLTLHGMAMTVEQIKTNALLRYILLWSVVGVVLVFNIPYMRQIQKVEDTKQLVVLQLAVVVWAISLHGALLFGAEIPPITGSALLVLFTAFSVFYVK